MQSLIAKVSQLIKDNSSIYYQPHQHLGSKETMYETC